MCIASSSCSVCFDNWKLLLKPTFVLVAIICSHVLEHKHSVASQFHFEKNYAVKRNDIESYESELMSTFDILI